jgi:DNA-binding HxlR family transcriptional regulator
MPTTTTTNRSYAQRCGIATALDVVGDRWAMLVVRELLLGPLRFRDLVDGLPGIATNTLADRLKDLEASGVIERMPIPLPDRGTAYSVTEYGSELEPILLALGRWGTKSMGRLPSTARTRSRWLVSAMLAFHAGNHPIERPLTCELRLSDGTFTLMAWDAELTIVAEASNTVTASADADLILTATDDELYGLLTHELTAAEAVASATVTVAGDPLALQTLIGLFAFPRAE